MHSNAPLYLPPKSANDLVLAWIRRARESQLAHYEMASTLTKRSYFFGTPVIIITAIVGTSVFSSIASENIPIEAKLAVGSLSVMASVLSSLQTFFKFSERAEKHNTFGARFGAIRRELELFYALDSFTNEANHLSVLRDKLDKLAEEAPHVSEYIFQKVQKTLSRQNTRNTLPQP